MAAAEKLKNQKITAMSGRYIKLGRKGAWEPLCIKDGTLRLGFYEVPHEYALARDKEAIRKIYVHKNPTVATNYARQVLDFYDPSDTVIWITFADGFLWWCQAAPEVDYISSDKTLYSDGSRLRRTISGWHNSSLSGKPLRISDLKGELTQIAGFQSTICSMKPHMLVYLLRKINDEELPEVVAAQQAKDDLLQTLQAMIAMLHWRDFELLVELIFAHSGWQRVSVVGETMKTTDIELLLPVTGEHAMVQVKSRTSQAEFDDYITAFSRWDNQRLFYIYHTAKGPLMQSDPDSRISLMGPDHVALLVLRAGLIEWVMDKAS